MSGKPQFDEAKVVAAAVQVFWRHGYAAASISDLTEATGLSRSSLYQRFGDKDGLFREALASYEARVLRRMQNAEGVTNRERLNNLLRAFIPTTNSARRPAGCLVARSCCEQVDLSDASRAAAIASAMRQRDVFTSILRNALVGNEISKDIDLEALAWHFLGVFHAVLNFPAAGADPSMLERMIDSAMVAWPMKRQH